MKKRIIRSSSWDKTFAGCIIDKRTFRFTRLLYPDIDQGLRLICIKVNQ
jgi:hypothetical protein